MVWNCKYYKLQVPYDSKTFFWSLFHKTITVKGNFLYLYAWIETTLACCKVTLNWPLVCLIIFCTPSLLLVFCLMQYFKLSHYYLISEWFIFRLKKYKLHRCSMVLRNDEVIVYEKNLSSHNTCHTANAFVKSRLVLLMK